MQQNFNDSLQTFFFKSNNQVGKRFIMESDNLVSSFGERLKRILKKRRLSQTKLARDLGLHINTVSGWMTNKYEPSLSTLKLLSKNLNIDLNWLITGKE